MRKNLLIATTFLICGQALQAAPPVYLELLLEGNPALGGAQKWSRFLSQCDFTNVRIRGGRPGDKTALDQKGTEASPRYYVVGIINARDMMELPGKRFRFGDKKPINEWIKKLQVEGKQGLFAVRGTFGLTKDELLKVHKQLSKTVQNETRGVRVGKVAESIIGDLKLPFTVSPAARAAFQSQVAVPEEFKAMSSGTSLAAVIRPLGLVMAPRKRPGKPVEIYFAKTGTIGESWPVGWPPQKTPGKSFPKMFKFLNISVNKSVLSKALESLEARMEGRPFLYDHNAMARHRIDPTTVKVSFPQKRSYYKRIIDDLLSRRCSNQRSVSTKTAFPFCGSRR